MAEETQGVAPKMTPKEITDLAFGKVEPVSPVASPAASAAPVVPDPPIEPVVVPEVKNSIDDISDEEFEKQLAKRTGGKVKSLNDLKEPPAAPTAEQLAEMQKKEKQEAIEWALGTNVIDRETYEKGLVEKSKSPRDIALSVLAEELREEDPKITKEEVEEIFADLYHEDKEEGSALRKAGLKKMEKVAAAETKNKYGVIDTVDEKYKEFRQDGQRHKDYTQRAKGIIELEPREYTVKVPLSVQGASVSEVSLSYKYDDEDLKAAAKMTNDYYSYKAVSADKKEIKDKVISDMFRHNLNQITAEKRTTFLVEQAIHQTAAAIKNVPQTNVRPIGVAIPAPKSGVSAAEAIERARKNSYN